ncbi:single-stranded DNA-binding protein [Candidatus Margulisiibacteriota bacterium]
MNFNRIVLVGRPITKPEMKNVDGGSSVVTFTLSCMRPPRQDGLSDTDDIPIVFQGRQVDRVLNDVTVGKLVLVEGKIVTRNYTDDQDQRIYVTEVLGLTFRILDAQVSKIHDDPTDTKTDDAVVAVVENLSQPDASKNEVPF